MYHQLINSLKKYDEFRYNGKGVECSEASESEIMQKFAKVINNGLSCTEPKIKNQDLPYANDSVITNFISTLIENREKYAEYHLDLAEDAFASFKKTFNDLKDRDDTLGGLLDEAIKQTNSAVKTLFSPRAIYRSCIPFYKHTFMGDISAEESKENVTQFHEAAILIVRCLLTITDKNSRSLIIDKANLVELNSDLIDKEKCITRDDFNKNVHLKKYFDAFKSLSEIISRVSHESREILIPLIIKIFSHVVCAIMSYKYCVEFKDLKGKYFFFGIFFGMTKHYSDLLKPFGVHINETAIQM